MIKKTVTLLLILLVVMSSFTFIVTTLGQARGDFSGYILHDSGSYRCSVLALQLLAILSIVVPTAPALASGTWTVIATDGITT